MFTANIKPQGLLVKRSSLIISVGKDPISLQVLVMDWEGKIPYLILCFDGTLETKRNPEGTENFTTWQL
jgi:hypothetical protein